MVGSSEVAVHKKMGEIEALELQAREVGAKLIGRQARTIVVAYDSAPLAPTESLKNIRPGMDRAEAVSERVPEAIEDLTTVLPRNFSRQVPFIEALERIPGRIAVFVPRQPREHSSALTHSEGAGKRWSLPRMASADLVQTKGVGSSLCSAM